MNWKKDLPCSLALVWMFSCGQKPEVTSVLFAPEEFEVRLWAESPMFFNPTNMDVDQKGRIWITEAVNYRNYNNDSGAYFHHSKGDRIMILMDTDQDGVADSSKVFVEDSDLVSPLGIAVLGNKVFVSCSPHLLVYTDEDGDDVPDKKEIFLTGFGGLDHDHSLHSILAGPDGKLYFNTGNAGPHLVTDKSGWTLRSGSVYTGGSPYNSSNSGGQVSDDGNIYVGGLALRINPDGTGLEVMAHNFRNSYEVFVDSKGDLWQNDNDDQVVACRVSWVPEGSNAGYFSQDGNRTWQADQRPGQDLFTAHWHQEDPGIMPAGDKTGAGSPTGMMRYEGDVFGSDFRGTLMSADAGRNVIFSYQPKLRKSGYDLGTRRILFSSLNEDDEVYVWNDTSFQNQKTKWFRPSDLVTGTDGAIYIADWYDPVVGGHQMKDSLGRGRIYRVVPKGKKLKSPELDYATDAGLIEIIKNPAVNVRFHAFELIRKKGEAAIPMIESLLKDD
ncbi:MAG: putative membrane-bound dehydrogenase-like protein, partial [Planctomycetota bacterium]